MFCVFGRRRRKEKMFIFRFSTVSRGLSRLKTLGGSGRYTSNARVVKGFSVSILIWVIQNNDSIVCQIYNFFLTNCIQLFTILRMLWTPSYRESIVNIRVLCFSGFQVNGLLTRSFKIVYAITLKFCFLFGFELVSNQNESRGLHVIWF